MCCRFYIGADSDNATIQDTISFLQDKGKPVKIGDVFPTDLVAVLANNRSLQIQPFAMNWGYHLNDGKLLINTRSETASQKPLFSNSMKCHRCVIPCSAYYEWQQTDNRKKKYKITANGSSAVFLAGIYRIEEKTPVFSILTKDPEENIAFIHDRMPVILPEEAIRDWLDLTCKAEEVLKRTVTDIVFEAC